MDIFALYSYDNSSGDSSNGNISKDPNCFELSIVSTNMEAENEAILRNFLAKKITKGTVFTGSGTVTNIELPCIDSDVTEHPFGVYFCLLKGALRTENSSLEKDFEEVGLSESSDDSSKSKDLIVCFIHQNKNVLDLFHCELDQFSEDILDLYSTDPQKIADHLMEWYTSAVLYIVRCVLLLKDKLDMFLSVASTNMEMEIIAGDSDKIKELKMFRDSCNIYEAYMHKQTEQKPVTIEIANESIQILGDSVISSPYCTELATAFLTAAKSDGDEAKTADPVSIKQMLQNFKLKVNHDMNLAKRLIIYAVNDFYALHRLYVFLKSTGNWKLVLHHLTESDLPTPEEIEVIDVVRDYLEMKDASVKVP